MTTPNDRTTLHAEVDERYHYRNPTAPYTIDPNDPAHQQWIPVWIEIRDEVLIAATNEHFFDQYPAAPQHLDPNDPGQQLYVMEWVRIRDQILGDGVTNANSDSSANTSEEPAPATTAEPSAEQFDQEASRVRDYLKGSPRVEPTADRRSAGEVHRGATRRRAAVSTSGAISIVMASGRHRRATSTRAWASTTSACRCASSERTRPCEWGWWATARPTWVAGRATPALPRNERKCQGFLKSELGCANTADDCETAEIRRPPSRGDTA